MEEMPYTVLHTCWKYNHDIFWNKRVINIYIVVYLEVSTSINVAIEEKDTDFFDLAMAKIETAMDLVSNFNEKIVALTQVDNIGSEITETSDYEINVKRKLQRLKKEIFSTQK